MQQDATGRPRPVSFQSRQLRKAERDYPVHDLELLAMKNALANFRIYLVGVKPFVVYTDHATLRMAINSPHISQRIARRLVFFAEFTFTVEYKPGRDNVLADALSCRPTTDNVVLQTISTVTSDMTTRIQGAYVKDPLIQPVWTHLTTGHHALIDSLNWIDMRLSMVSLYIAFPRQTLLAFMYPVIRVCDPHCLLSITIRLDLSLVTLVVTRRIFHYHGYFFGLVCTRPSRNISVRVILLSE